MYFYIYQGQDNWWYWRLYNGDDIIATGHQKFSTYQLCENQIALVRQCYSAPVRN